MGDGSIHAPTNSCSRLVTLAADVRRSAVEVSIEKYEKTAMQWLQEQTQNN